MRREPGFIYRLFLLIGDAMAIVVSFAFAYYFRVNFDPRPYVFNANSWDFFVSILVLLPIWAVILVSLGLYKRSVVESRLVTVWRLFIASFINTMGLISYDFFMTAITGRESLFPVKIIALYAIPFCFVALLLTRLVINIVFSLIRKSKRGLIRVVVSGDGDNVRQLILGISPETGFKVCGVVADNEYVPSDWKGRRYDSLEEAAKRLHPDAIIYAAEDGLEEANALAINHHALFYYSPPESSIIALSGNVEFIAGVPVFRIRATPLTGAAQFYKRVIDIITSFILIILASPIMLILFILQKIIEPKSPAIYKDTRLTRYNREFPLLKFRTIRQAYSGLTPEQAFEKMGRPELIERYRKSGDYVKNDPRYTKFGKFLRATSLDELPQLFNVLVGDISLIGPRALQPCELEGYGDRGLLLSIKSGVTGLAQVSGRRDISFNERRALDIYYVQNWTPLLDLSIFIRTIIVIFKRSGAK
jgi:exopolysaccharide biosynthesis polyprenyl glycosylphosphotransferase